MTHQERQSAQQAVERFIKSGSKDKMAFFNRFMGNYRLCVIRIYNEKVYKVLSYEELPNR